MLLHTALQCIHKAVGVMTKEEKWYALLREWEQLSLTQSAFCRIKGVRLHSFRYWRTKGIESGEFKSVKLAKKQADKPLFAGVDLSPVQTTSSTPSMLELHLPHGIILKIPA